MEMVSSLALRPSLPTRINSRPSRSPIPVRFCSLPVVSAWILPTQSNRPRETAASSLAIRALGDMTVAPSRSTERFSSDISESDDMTVCEDGGVEDGSCDAANIDDSKMMRVCDKLIEVFMVDKPTTTDWRRLLAFSREWIDIRPHFYKRCQERADSESDPGMKHKLLRLGRKLKEIDDDVQRHNELLELIREAPDEISAIVARRRKDFTKDFFVHLHTVAESYYDDLQKQNGKT